MGLCIAVAGMLVPANVGAQASPKKQDPSSVEWWSLYPINRPAVPSLKAGAAKNPIDAFIAAKLAEKSLTLSPEADRRTLIRRVTFDLTGLPPMPADVEAFAADADPQAYEKLIDRLLASSAYGERWGRHWLDVAHYADTHGFERDQRRPNAWRYRDWVIDAINRDVPYNDFIRMQIAGDVIAPDDPSGKVATGFLAAGPWDFVGHEETKSPMLRRKARADDLDDMVTTVVTSTMALTINCARCHDHKFDPLPQSDYYRLTAVFTGVRRGDRSIDPKADARRKSLADEIAALDQQLLPGRGDAIDLAGVVGGGTRGNGIDPRSGQVTHDRAQFLPDVKVNTFTASPVHFVDGVFIPDGGDDAVRKIVATSTGLVLTGLPKTSGMSWDYVVDGPFTQQKSTKLGAVDYAAQGDGHSMLGLHVNKGITFDLKAMREANAGRELTHLTAVAGNGDIGPSDFWIYLDGVLKSKQEQIKDSSGPFPIDIPLKPADRFLTLVATDGGDGISNDQIFFGDPRITLTPVVKDDAAEAKKKDTLVAKRESLKNELAALPADQKVYGIVPGDAPQTNVLRRGDPESPGATVTPGPLSCVSGVASSLGDGAMSEGQRRLALANWITDPRNPLTARVIVNRLWHYHFGKGLVGTPSDFGRNGERPSHPELLDWLASEFQGRHGSLKSMHRLILLSNTYRQTSTPGADAIARGAAVDADDRLLWRMNGRRLEAEEVRDSILAVSGKLDRKAGGPGYEPFKFIDKYAPIYEYITADRPELWRRTVYAFSVRSVPDGFMDVLDCPNPSNLTPARSATTTALQALAMANNPFVMQQAKFFADRVKSEAAADVNAQVKRAYQLAFGRFPAAEEIDAAKALIEKQGLFSFCRALLNGNEFVYVD